MRLDCINLDLSYRSLFRKGNGKKPFVLQVKIAFKKDFQIPYFHLFGIDLLFLVFKYLSKKILEQWVEGVTLMNLES